MIASVSDGDFNGADASGTADAAPGDADEHRRGAGPARFDGPVIPPAYREPRAAPSLPGAPMPERQRALDVLFARLQRPIRAACRRLTPRVAATRRGVALIDQDAQARAHAQDVGR